MQTCSSLKVDTEVCVCIGARSIVGSEGTSFGACRAMLAACDLQASSPSQLLPCCRRGCGMAQGCASGSPVGQADSPEKVQWGPEVFWGRAGWGWLPARSSFRRPALPQGLDPRGAASLLPSPCPFSNTPFFSAATSLSPAWPGHPDQPLPREQVTGPAPPRITTSAMADPAVRHPPVHSCLPGPPASLHPHCLRGPGKPPAQPGLS